MDQDPADRNILSLIVDHTDGHVVVEYLAGPQVTEENFDQVVKERQVLKGQPEAKTAAMYLHGYSTYGIEVKRSLEEPGTRFIPWGAVLAIQGHSRVDLESYAREDIEQRQTRQTEENNPT